MWWPRVAPGVATALALAVAGALGLQRAWRARASADRHRRGAVVVGSPRRFTQIRQRRYPKSHSQLIFAGTPVPPMDETKHFKLIGTTGTGKSTAIRELIMAALRRGDRAIITDPDGGYHARLYRRHRGDIVLNPFERDSVGWDLFAEIRDPFDVDQLASALIPHSDDPSTREWRSYARTLFTAIARRCHTAGRADIALLWRLLATAAPEDLRPLAAGTPAQAFLESDNGRMFGSIRSVLMSAIAPLEYVHGQRGLPFSVRAWVRSGRGALFMPYRAAQIAALRTIIAAWMRLAIVEAMSRDENHDQRLWFVVDELDALGAIDGLKDALARLRKFGGRCVLGFQSIAQVSSTYGAGEAQTIVENCGNTLILRCSGSEHGGTSQFASRLVGEREVRRRQLTRSSDREAGWSMRGARRSVQISDQFTVETALMPSEIEQLPDLAGYLKLASSAWWRRVALQY